MTEAVTELDIGTRLAEVLDSLGIERAHFATANMSPLTALDQVSPSRIASLTLVDPSVIDEDMLERHPDRVIAVFGQPRTPGGDGARRFISALAGARVVDLPEEFVAVPGADIVAKNMAPIEDAILAAMRTEELAPVSFDARSGSSHGVTYRVSGDGAPLILLPVGLAPSQWSSLLNDNPGVCRLYLGGRHLPPVDFLDGRAFFPGYERMVQTLFSDLAIEPGERVLEVGTGTGALVRQLARRTKGENAIEAVDLSGFMLGEAQAIAKDEGLESVLNFQHGDGTDLPFDSGSIDVAFSVTVFEECDADQAIAELLRVLRVGGRAGVIVRAVDIPEYWHLDLPDQVKAKVDVFPTWGVSADGCGDGTLYRRFIRAGFSDLKALPIWARYPSIPLVTDGVVSGLPEPDASLFTAALNEARFRGEGWVSKPFHCAIGTKA